ncbi:MAG: putative ABC transporter permease [Bacilli bacterium]|nr:putative ABC transporter permease [Bacilli bacterium]
MKYIIDFKDKKIDTKLTISILMLSFVIAGIIGYIYEVIFYKFDKGEFINRGSTYGPWIPVYAVGTLLIILLLYRFKKNLWFVSIFCAIITFAVEYLTGWFFHKIIGVRLWDYNIEILNFGNINGYVCLRSVLLFTLGGIFVIYSMVPTLIKIAKKVNKKAFCITSIVLFTLFILDIIIWGILH